MLYVAYIVGGLILIHFILYYLNIDVFNWFNQQTQHTHDEKITIADDSIEESINELKKLNEYIDNGHQ
jgi:hypothetical protein